LELKDNVENFLKQPTQNFKEKQQKLDKKMSVSSKQFILIFLKYFYSQIFLTHFTHKKNKI